MLKRLAHSLVFRAHCGTGGAGLTGGALELGVGTLADSTLAFSSAIADGLVACHAGAGV